MRGSRSARGAGSENGFTLIEVLVVVAIMGIALLILVGRGPNRSAALDLRAGTQEVAGALRLARARAIETGAPVTLLLDAHGYRLGNDGAHALPPAVALLARGPAGQPVAGIRFAGDGSSSGGQVVLAAGTRRAAVGVNWFTGRVAVETAAP